VLTAFGRAFRTPDLRKKILFTLAIMGLFRLGSVMPAPGVNYQAVHDCIDVTKNSSIYGLGSSIFTKDMAKARKAAELLDAGYTWVNDIQVAYDQLPFGGAKQSGFGKEHGMEAIESYTEKKSVVLAG